jgi:Tol biopolymer transport system component
MISPLWGVAFVVVALGSAAVLVGVYASLDRDRPAAIPEAQVTGHELALTSHSSIILLSEGQDERVVLAEGHSPRWSPRGDQLAFVCATTQPNVCVMDIATRGVRQIRASASNPVWSPDGAHLAFTSWGDFSDNLYVLDLTSMATKQIPSGGSQGHMRTASCPAWSTDGAQLAFLVYDSILRQEEVVVGDANGRHQVIIAKRERLTGLGCASAPQWSPTANKLVIVRQATEIVSVDANGSNARQLGFGEHPRWSPDGGKLAFVASEKLYVVNSDGTELRQVARTRYRFPCTPGLDCGTTAPSWSPDGHRIAFGCQTGGICVIDIDQPEPIRRISSEVRDNGPVWKPVRG